MVCQALEVLFQGRQHHSAYARPSVDDNELAKGYVKVATLDIRLEVNVGTGIV